MKDRGPRVNFEKRFPSIWSCVGIKLNMPAIQKQTRYFTILLVVDKGNYICKLLDPLMNCAELVFNTF